MSGRAQPTASPEASISERRRTAGVSRSRRKSMRTELSTRTKVAAPERLVVVAVGKPDLPLQREDSGARLRFHEVPPCLADEGAFRSNTCEPVCFPYQIVLEHDVRAHST